MDIKNILIGLLTLACFLLLVSCRQDSAPKPGSVALTDVNEGTAKVELTLSIIKPNAVAKHHVGAIIHRFENRGLHVAGLRMIQLTQSEAEQFYALHKDRPFYKELVTFMTSGPVVVMALEGPGAILKNREIMGATDPKKAAPGTIRADFAESITANAVHGSDAPETAAQEVAFFFKPEELFR